MEMNSKKTTLISPVPTIHATSSSTMMSPPSEPELTPKQVNKAFQLCPESDGATDPATGLLKKVDIKEEPGKDGRNAEKVEAEKSKESNTEKDETTVEQVDYYDDDVDDELVIDVGNEEGPML
jgi:hypothetical protein